MGFGIKISGKSRTKSTLRHSRDISMLFRRLFNENNGIWNQNSFDSKKSTPRDSRDILNSFESLFNVFDGIWDQNSSEKSTPRDSQAISKPFGCLLNVLEGIYNRKSTEKSTPRDKYAKFANFYTIFSKTFLRPSYFPSFQLITDRRRSIKPPKTPIKPKTPATEQNKLQ